MLENRIFQKLVAAETRGRLGHALLLVCPISAKKEFQQHLRPFLQTLLCETFGEKLGEDIAEQVDGQACGRCSSCESFQSKQNDENFAHPDFFHLKPEKRGSYVVDQIKGMRSFLSLTRASSPIKVVLIEEAEALGSGGGAAANALLKVLEEPRDKVKLLLVSSRPDGVLPTIRSRCQSFRFQFQKESDTPEQDDGLQDWLPLFHWIQQGGSPETWPSLELPADKDAFFKEKEEAQEILSSVFRRGWEDFRLSANSLPPAQSANTLEWFHDFEKLLAALKNHGQSGLQWSSFKYRARN